MHHCWGTDASVNAPWYFAGAGQPAQLYPLDTAGYSTPGHRNDKMYDALLALVDWVEKGTAVDSIIATAYNANSVTENRTRPLLPMAEESSLGHDKGPEQGRELVLQMIGVTSGCVSHRSGHGCSSPCWAGECKVGLVMLYAP